MRYEQQMRLRFSGSVTTLDEAKDVVAAIVEFIFDHRGIEGLGVGPLEQIDERGEHEDGDGP